MEQTNSQEEINLEYCRASSGKRLANYVIDMVVFYIISVFIGMIIGVILGVFMPDVIDEWHVDSFVERIISLLLYGMVMFVMEAIFQGKSIGKMITRTRAVNIYGEVPTIGQFMRRNFIRAIPFNMFSGLGSPCSPWHDNWSDTIVVDEQALYLQQRKDVFFSELKNQTQSGSHL